MTASANELGAPTQEDLLRADFYDFLASLLTKPPAGNRLKGMAAMEGDDTPIGQALAAIGKVARHVDEQAVEREFHHLFIGLGRGELLPFGSYYLTGFLNEKPLAALRSDMQRLGMVRVDDVSEPEDHIGSLCEMMAGLIRGRFGQTQDLATQQAFYAAHIEPWASHFFSDLEKAKTSVFYTPVGTAGRTFMEIESEAFRIESS